MNEGSDGKAAYKAAAANVLANYRFNSNHLALLLPIAFWPGVAGQFMSYLPITVFAVLIGSLFYALLFAPAIGLGHN